MSAKSQATAALLDGRNGIRKGLRVRMARGELGRPVGTVLYVRQSPHGYVARVVFEHAREWSVLLRCRRLEVVE